MNHVRGNGDRQVASNGSRLSGKWIRCANHLAKCVYGVRCLQHQKDNRARRNMVDKFLEEGLVLVDAVEGFCLLVGNLVES